ncbi:MAG: NEW3 domain-containing protein [Bacteroidota bacterium]
MMYTPISHLNGRLLAALVLAFVFLIPPTVVDVSAQSGTFFNQRDDTYPLLGLRRAKEAFDTQKVEYERQKGLHDKQLISEAALEQAFRNYSEAEVNFQQSLLAVIFEQQYIVVSRAVKYQKDNRKKGVRLTLENASKGSGEYEKLIGIDDSLFTLLKPDVVNNIYISLLNDDNAIISQPYERKIDQLLYGKPKTVNFELLQELDAVTVSLIYGNGSQQSRKIYLQKDDSENIASIKPEQFSQEVELSGNTDYRMSLELFSSDANTFKLEAVNLPSEINRYFVDPATDNRLSQFQFTEGVNTREAALRIFLPERPTDNVKIDEGLTFFAISIPRERIEEIGDVSRRQMTEEEIQALNVGYAKLELVPRGIGEILVRAPLLSFTIKPDEEVVVNLEVVNEGTRSLNNVRVEADPPLNWTDTISPEVIQSLDINEEQQIQLRFKPAPNVAPGRYEVRVQTTSLSDDLPIRGEDKTISIQIEAEANVFGTLIVVLLIIGLVLAIIIFGIRLSRR